MSIKGYEGIGPENGKFVRAEDALIYASERCGIRKIDVTAPDAAEFMEMLVEWFFSGNWVTVCEDGDNDE